jgi:hypothetical protein
MSKNIPLYQRYPDLYAYDTEVKKHILKSGILYRKRYALYPSRFVESKTMFPRPIPQVQNLNIQRVEQKPTLTQIGYERSSIDSLNHKSVNPMVNQINPSVQYSHPVQTIPQVPQINKQQEAEDIRNSIQSIIREELKKNNETYKNKEPEEMSTMFRKLLIEKLSGQVSHKQPVEKQSNSSYKSITTKSQTDQQSKWKFQMANLLNNDNIDDYGDDEYLVDEYDINGNKIAPEGNDDD